MARPRTLEVNRITVDDEVCARPADDPTVRRYATAYKKGEHFPAIICFQDATGRVYLADGRQRLAAAVAAGLGRITAFVKLGSRRQAQRFAIEANARHGLPLIDNVCESVATA